MRTYPAILSVLRSKGGASQIFRSTATTGHDEKKNETIGWGSAISCASLLPLEMSTWKETPCLLDVTARNFRAAFLVVSETDGNCFDGDDCPTSFW